MKNTIDYLIKKQEALNLYFAEKSNDFDDSKAFYLLQDQVRFVKGEKKKYFYAIPIANELLFNKPVLKIIKFPYIVYREFYIFLEKIFKFLENHKIMANVLGINDFLIKIYFWMIRPKILESILTIVLISLIPSAILVYNILPQIVFSLSSGFSISTLWLATAINHLAIKNKVIEKVIEKLSIDKTIKKCLIHKDYKNVFNILYNNFSNYFNNFFNRLDSIRMNFIVLMISIFILIPSAITMMIGSLKMLITKRDFPNQKHKLKYIKHFWTINSSVVFKIESEKTLTKLNTAMKRTLALTPPVGHISAVQKDKMQPAGYYAFHFAKCNLISSTKTFLTLFKSLLKYKLEYDKSFIKYFIKVPLEIWYFTIKNITPRFLKNALVTRSFIDRVTKIKNLFVKEGKNSKKSKGKRNTYVMEKDSRKIFSLGYIK